MPLFKRPPVSLGPFGGGLNASNDPSKIASNELQDVDNFDIGTDGVLISRPPIAILATGPTAGTTTEVLGYYKTSAGANQLIVSKGIAGSTATTGVYWYNGGSWTLIANIACRVVVQYNGLLWIIGETTAGGYWDGATYTTVASMPIGGCAVVYKDRLFVGAGYRSTTNTSRITFSNPGDPTLWTSTDFIDIAKGDGQKVNDLYVQGNNVYIFKDDSTYVFSYDAAPTNGTLNKISSLIGTAETSCVAEWQGLIFVYHENDVYELNNYVYTRISIKPKLTPGYTGTNFYFKPASLSVLGDRLVVSYFDKVYVYHLLLKAWTTWVSSLGTFGKFWQEPMSAYSYLYPKYFAGSAVSGTNNVYSFYDTYSSGNSESMVCSITTKNFDFGDPSYYKKLLGWNLDILSTSSVMGSVTPVVYGQSITWSQAQAFTWASRLSGGYIWNLMSTALTSISQSVLAAGTMARKLLKFTGALRFRSIYFTISTTVTGVSSDSPVKLFEITPVIAQKEYVNKAVN
jgi:hypothetical protein